MALESSATEGPHQQMALELRQRLLDMWHPHVYGTPPKTPTPFSIDDILNNRQQHQPRTEDVPLSKITEWQHILATLALQQQMLANATGLHAPQPALGNFESERDSIQSTPPESDEAEDQEAAQQPLNLSNKRASIDPYDQEFLDVSSDHHGK